MLTHNIPDKPFLRAVCETVPCLIEACSPPAGRLRTKGWKSSRPEEDHPGDSGPCRDPDLCHLLVRARGWIKRVALESCCLDSS